MSADHRFLTEGHFKQVGFKSFLKLLMLLFNRMVVGKVFQNLTAAIPKALSAHFGFCMI